MRLVAAAAGLQPAAAVSAAGRGEAASTVRATLDAPINAPDFADALGARVSLFAADGVQQAELHLNPAETGPIHVRIALDAATGDGAAGTQARVEFHAELQATRDAIEASLPGLAASMREQGLTLAGGGVFQGAPGRDGQAAGGGDGDAGRRTGGRGAAAAGTAPEPSRTMSAAARRPARIGGLDVYA